MFDGKYSIICILPQIFYALTKYTIISQSDSIINLRRKCPRNNTFCFVESWVCSNFAYQ